MKWLHSVAFRIQALSLATLALISIAFLVVFIQNAEKVSKENHKKASELSMNHMAVSVKFAISPAMELVSSAATFVEGKGRDELEDIFAKMATTDSSIYDLYYGTVKSRFAGGMFTSGSGWRPYEDPDEKDWDQVARPWFIEAMEAKGKTIITEPYIDSETKRYVFTLAKTAKSSKGEFIGVVAADIFLDVMNSIVEANKITEDGVTFLVDSTGRYLTHKDIKNILNKSLFDDFKEFGEFKDIIPTEKTRVVFTDDHYLVASRVNGTNWYLVSAGSIKTLDKKSITSILLVILVSIIIAAIASLFFGKTITKSITQAMRSFDIIGAGDITHRLEIHGKDEIANMSIHFNKFIDNLHDFIRIVVKDVNTLDTNSHKLSGISGNLAEASELTVNKSNSVVSDAGQMVKSIKDIASMADNTNMNVIVAKGAAEQMSEHIETITSAMEKMDKNIEEIEENTLNVCKVATEATEKSVNATNVISKLGVAAKEIGQVTDVIKKIADKTNLLALNATIEAASAGEAGKGFAVVAGEIKELANQSAASADDIANRIESIQNGTNDAIAVIHDVADIIVKINNSVKETEGHVDAQNKASAEIVNNVELSRDEAKKVAESIMDIVNGTKGISENANGISNNAIDISKNIKSVNDVASQIQDAAIEIHDSVDGFSKISINLQNKLKQFKVAD